MSKHSIFLSGKGFSMAALFSLAILVCIYTLSEEPDEVAATYTPEITTDSDDKQSPESPTEDQGNGLVVLPGIEKKGQDFDFDDEMKLRLQRISEAYEEQIKYPSFSVPIEAGELESKYLPDMPVATELPADFKNPDSPSLSVTPGQFRYFSGDVVTARADISGLDVEENSYVSARLLMQGKPLGFAVVVPVEERAHSFQLTFDPLALNAIEWKENMTIEVEFHVLDEIYTRSISVEYLNTIAQVEDIAGSEVQGEYLLIPVYVATEKPGFHRLQANLYDANSDAPLVHLVAEDQLTSTNGLLTFKAHISALKAAGSEGPYRLKDLMLRRLPSEPDYITEFGRIEQNAFEVEGYRFSAYQDKPYINQKAQRIANELRKLGS